MLSKFSLRKYYVLIFKPENWGSENLEDLIVFLLASKFVNFSVSPLQQGLEKHCIRKNWETSKRRDWRC